MSGSRVFLPTLAVVPCFSFCSRLLCSLPHFFACESLLCFAHRYGFRCEENSPRWHRRCMLHQLQLERTNRTVDRNGPHAYRNTKHMAVDTASATAATQQKWNRVGWRSETGPGNSGCNRVSNAPQDSDTRTLFSQRHHIMRKRIIATPTHTNAHTPMTNDTFQLASYFTEPMNTRLSSHEI